MPTAVPKHRTLPATERLHISVNCIIAVLLFDGWHRVRRGSFEVMPVDFVCHYRGKDGPITRILHGQGSSAESDLHYAIWEEDPDPESECLRFTCPLSEIRCMKEDPWESHDNDGNPIPVEPASE